MNPNLSPETTDLIRLASFHAEWSQETFGPDHLRGPLGPLEHIREEALEAGAGDMDDITEFADLLLLVLDAARRAGFSAAALVLAASRKLRVNMARDWPDWRTADLTRAAHHIERAALDECRANLAAAARPLQAEIAPMDFPEPPARQSVVRRALLGLLGGAFMTAPEPCVCVARKIGRNVGDIVQIVSGGCAMTVVYADCCEAECVWFDCAKMRTETFPLACLKPADPEQEVPF